MTPYNIPGSVASIPKIGLPVTIAALSTLLVLLPMILKSFGSLSFNVVGSGGANVSALSASAP